MSMTKIAAIATGVLVIVLALVAAAGIPARGLIESYSRAPLAQQDLVLDITGNARFRLWPRPGLTLDAARLRDARASTDLVQVERIEAAVDLGELARGRIRLSEVALTRPTLRSDAMLDRAARAADQRTNPRRNGGSDPAAVPFADAALAVDTVTVVDGVVVVRDGSETRDLRIDSLRLSQLPSASSPGLRAEARLGRTTVRLTTADGPARLIDGQPVAIAAAVEAPELFRNAASFNASVTRTGPVVRFDGIDGSLDQGRVRGSVSLSFAGPKPFVDATLESDRLDLTGLIDAIQRPDAAGPGGRPAVSAGAETPWRETPFDLFGLRLVEGNLGLTAREMTLEAVRIGPAAVEISLLQDVLTAKLSPSGLYGGQASGELSIDRSGRDPLVTLRSSFSGLNALPFLRDAAGFAYVDGRARGSLDLRGSGASPRRVAETLSGRIDLLLEDGSVRGVNLPGMVRSLLDTVLTGWQGNASDQTRFSSFGASFTVDNGVARSNDVRFVGPYLVMSATGAADIRAKTLEFRAEPRLTGAAESSDRRSEPWSIGVPVVVQGPWSQPRIYADVPDVLANPDAALRALRGALGGPGAAPFGKLIEGLNKSFGQPGETPPQPATRADDIMRALKGDPAPAPALPAPPGETASSPPPPPPPAASPPAASPPQASAATSAPTPAPARTPAPRPTVSRENRSRPAAEPSVRELEQGAREFLRDLLGGANQ